MAIKAVAVDDENTQHLIHWTEPAERKLLIGRVRLAIALSENSDIVLLFAETDEDLEKHFPTRMRPA